MRRICCMHVGIDVQHLPVHICAFRLGPSSTETSSAPHHIECAVYPHAHLQLVVSTNETLPYRCSRGGQA